MKGSINVKLVKIVLLFNIVFFFGWTTAVNAQKVNHHHLSVSLDPVNHMLQATDHIALDLKNNQNTPFTMFLNKNLAIDMITSFDKPITFAINNEFDLSKFYDTVDDKLKENYETAVAIELTPPANGWGNDTVEMIITYHGAIYDTTELSDDETTGLIDERGTFLAGASFWYPDIPYSFGSFQLNTQTPADYRVISQGDEIANTVENNIRKQTWSFPHPTDEIYCIAGKYFVSEIDYQGVKIQTWLYAPDSTLTQTYFDWTKKYLDMYSDMIGPYPFHRFAIAENFFQTGFGMPTFTLLGSVVIRMPYIPSTSLGHEILHNWWGNSVYVDYQSGNWCEGLTTYLADQMYKTRESDALGVDYRRNTCQNYTSFVTTGNDFPLINFRNREDAATQAIGYGKTMMVYHMLSLFIGEDTFIKGLKKLYADYQFKMVSWKDIETVFQSLTDKPLSPFFQQWLSQAGSPYIELQKATTKRQKDKFKLDVTVTQAEPVYNLQLPIQVEFVSGKKTYYSTFNQQTQQFTFDLDEKPLSVSVDGHYDLFRKLLPGEVPPTFTQFFGDTLRILVYPTQSTPEKLSAYQEIGEKMNRKGKALSKNDNEVTKTDRMNHSLLFMGDLSENKLLQKEFAKYIPAGVNLNPGKIELMGKSFTKPEQGIALVIQNPLNAEHYIAVVSGNSPDVIKAGLRKVMYYGKYSYLAFENENNVSKGVWEAIKSPLTIHFE